MDALLSGKYDLNHTAVIITQTGGGCRASNYIGFIRRALKKAGMEHIPVISLNLSGLEDNPGFKLSPALVLRGIYAAVFGDIFMKCVYRMRPYEAVPGTTDKIHRKWAEVVKKFVSEDVYKRQHYSGMFPRFSQVQNQENSTIILETVKKSNFLSVGSIPRK